MRWSTAQSMAGPWIASDPKMSRPALSGAIASKAWWVSMRWKPIVIPKPHSTYMPANSARSLGPTALFQSSVTAAISPANGRIVITIIAVLRPRSGTGSSERSAVM